MRNVDRTTLRERRNAKRNFQHCGGEDRPDSVQAHYIFPKFIPRHPRTYCVCCRVSTTTAYLGENNRAQREVMLRRSTDGVLTTHGVMFEMAHEVRLHSRQEHVKGWLILNV